MVVLFIGTWLELAVETCRPMTVSGLTLLEPCPPCNLAVEKGKRGVCRLFFVGYVNYYCNRHALALPE